MSRRSQYYAICKNWNESFNHNFNPFSPIIYIWWKNCVSALFSFSINSTTETKVYYEPKLADFCCWQCFVVFICFLLQLWGSQNENQNHEAQKYFKFYAKIIIEQTHSQNNFWKHSWDSCPSAHRTLKVLKNDLNECWNLRHGYFCRSIFWTARRPAKIRRTGTTPNFESQLVTPKPEALLENYPCESFLVWSQFWHFFNSSLVIYFLGSFLDKTGKCGLMITDYSSVVFN